VNILETVALGKRYRSRWALHGCDLVVPGGSVVGLVGANGAGKTTLLHLAVGLQLPSAGSIRVFGNRPGDDAAQLARVGFLAQDAPTYSYLTVAEHLRLGRALNHGWDDDLARRRIDRLGLDRGQRAGRLSGGQRSQLALTLAMGKHPDLLLLDEPVSSLDPLARREFLQDLMELVAEHGTTVVLSSHLLSDVERVCDHLIVLAEGRVRVSGAVDVLLATHKLLTGPPRGAASFPHDQHVVQVRSTERQTTALVRTSRPIFDPRWVVSDIGLEELVLAYMASDSEAPARTGLAAVAS
jgi:ABC-2 type transport system ATP-binding protein